MIVPRDALAEGGGLDCEQLTRGCFRCVLLTRIGAPKWTIMLPTGSVIMWYLCLPVVTRRSTFSGTSAVPQFGYFGGSALGTSAVPPWVLRWYHLGYFASFETCSLTWQGIYELGLMHSYIDVGPKVYVRLFVGRSHT